LLELATAELRVVEGSLQDQPGLRLAEREARRVHATAPRAGQHIADGDAVAAERLAHFRGLGATRLVEIALGRAVIEPGRRRIEGAGRVAVAQDHDAAGLE